MKGGSEDVRLVQAAQRCQAQRCQARSGAWHARRYAQRAEQGGGRGGRGRRAGQEGATPAISQRIATPPTAAFFGALSASAPARRR